MCFMLVVLHVHVDNSEDALALRLELMYIAPFGPLGIEPRSSWLG